MYFPHTWNVYKRMLLSINTQQVNNSTLMLIPLVHKVDFSVVAWVLLVPRQPDKINTYESIWSLEPSLWSEIGSYEQHNQPPMQRTGKVANKHPRKVTQQSIKLCILDPNTTSVSHHCCPDSTTYLILTGSQKPVHIKTMPKDMAIIIDDTDQRIKYEPHPWALIHRPWALFGTSHSLNQPSGSTGVSLRFTGTSGWSWHIFPLRATYCTSRDINWSSCYNSQYKHHSRHNSSRTCTIQGQVFHWRQGCISPRYERSHVQFHDTLQAKTSSIKRHTYTGHEIGLSPT